MFSNCSAGPHSRLIRQSDAFVDVPVFRSVGGRPSRSGHLGESIVELGRMVGFEHHATPYSLRRGYANMLYARASAEDRRFLMGHKTNSEIYSHYHSTVSAVHVQELFRSVREIRLADMHGLSVNRLAQLPQTISPEGWQRVEEDPEVIRFGGETARRNAELRDLYGSTTAAVRARTGPPRCHRRLEEPAAGDAAKPLRRGIPEGLRRPFSRPGGGPDPAARSRQRGRRR